VKRKRTQMILYGTTMITIDVVSLCSNTDSQVQGDENVVAITSFQEAASSFMGRIVDGIVDGFYRIKVAIFNPPFSDPEPAATPQYPNYRTTEQKRM
jgi:hypothetical protein